MAKDISDKVTELMKAAVSKNMCAQLILNEYNSVNRQYFTAWLENQEGKQIVGLSEAFEYCDKKAYEEVKKKYNL